MSRDAATEPLDLDDIQGLVVRGYGRLPHACYVMLRVGVPESARATLGAWAAEVTPASTSPRDRALQVAVTASGVTALTGRAADELGFAEPFVTGMATPYRSRLLGDVGANAPDTWTWGAPGTDRVDVAALLYADTADHLRSLRAAVTREAVDGGLGVVTVLETGELSEREHFGFHDGISQPRVAGAGDTPPDGGDEIRAGEFVLGYVNEYDQRTERPLVPRTWDRDGILPRDPDGDTADLGRNGSYLVLRQLAQDVEAFEDFLDRAAGPAGAARERLAAKIVGRWRASGAPLALAPQADDPGLARANDFAYHHEDGDGRGCPVGAHIRRTNPRDALPPRPGTPASRAVNVRHRLLRRGRSYGQPWTGDPDAGRAAERGLYFLCLGTNLARQYEFVQHSWVNDPSFDGLVDVEDPLVGPRTKGASSYAVPADPVSWRIHGLPQFVRVRGGAYFFLPGLRALRYLAATPTGGA